MNTLDRAFYTRDTCMVARELLGKVLLLQTGEERLSAVITETEAYLGVTDRACHSYGGRRTRRNETMYGPPGHAYVYRIYGLYDCLNAVTQEEGTPEAVLIRAVHPLEGTDRMAMARYGLPFSALTSRQRKGLADGPGKLCQAFGIDRNFNGEDICTGRLTITSSSLTTARTIHSGSRIGIDYAGEAASYPLRYWIQMD